jgi:hypothetical protein
MATERIREGLRGVIQDAKEDPYVVIDGILVALALVVLLSLALGFGVRT